MKWVKKGLIFRAGGEFGWIKSHAQIPTVLVKKDILRVYFATRPQAGLSCIAMMDLDINDPQKIIKIYDKPVLIHGDSGEFDEHGVMPNWVLEENGKIYLIYVGWSRRESIPYSNWTGLAVSEDGGLSFTKCFKGPVVDRTKDEILSATGLFGIKENGIWHGFYATGTKWYLNNGKYDSAYEIVKTESRNLINWEKRDGKPILITKLENEANTRPTIIKLNDLYHMWFCYRGTQDYHDGINSYKIGYAYSKDLITWERDDDKVEIEISVEGWDSKMMAYPYVVKANDKYLLFYCGNGFGMGGFGYAEFEL